MRPRGCAVLLAVVLATATASARREPTGQARLETLLHPKGTAKGTVVFFHGFSAKPSQWMTYGRWLHRQKGLDVIAVPLPGHDLPLRPDGTPDLSRLPKAAELDKYLHYNEAVFRLARRRGTPIHVVGLSAGGAQALWMALRHGHERLGDQPLIRSVIAVNPFLEETPRSLGPLRLSMGLAQRVFDGLDRLSFGRASSLLDRRRFDLDSGRNPMRSEAAEHSFRFVRLGHVVALHRFGQLVLRSAKPLVGPRVRLFLSEDPVANPEANLRWARTVGAEVQYVPVPIHNLMNERAHYGIFRSVTDAVEKPAARE